MNFGKRLASLLLSGVMALGAAGTALGAADGETVMPREQVVEYLELVNDYWISTNKTHGRAFWDNAAYHTGNMEAYFMTGIEAYREYSEAWSNHNAWKGATSTNKDEWNSGYDESPRGVLFGDWQICFQTYVDLYNIDPDESKIARAREVMEHEMSLPRNDFWWWADGLYMVMPVMTKLYLVTGNSQYLDKLNEYYRYAKSIMYDGPDGYAEGDPSTYTYLFFRDGGYTYPKYKSGNGLKDFWARGDGWVFAGLAKVLQDCPSDWEHRDYFKNDFLKMAETLKTWQQPDGYWTRSIMDPDYVPGPETSGTAFFTYGFLWGINSGTLDEATYLATALKGWDYLTKIAIDANGKVGYVQPIGAQAIKGQTLDPNTTSNFGVGATLLAASEMARYSGGMTGDCYPYLRKRMLTQRAYRIGSPYTYQNSALTATAAPVREGDAVYVAADSLGDLANGKAVVQKNGVDMINVYDLGCYVTVRGDVVILGHKSDPFYACEDGLVTMLDTMLQSGQYPVRTNKAKDFTVKIAELTDANLIRPAAVATSAAAETGCAVNRAFDRNLDSRWSVKGEGEVIVDLGEAKQVAMVGVSFWKYGNRTANYEIQCSADGSTYTPVYSGTSVQGTQFMLSRVDQSVRYIKVIGRGNSKTDWTNISEITVYAPGETKLQSNTN